MNKINYLKQNRNLNKITLQQVANATGLSITTVDRVINRRGGVSKKSEIKILQAAQALKLDRFLFIHHLQHIRVAVLMQPPSNHYCEVLKNTFDELNHSNQSRITFFLHSINVQNIPETIQKIKNVSIKYDALVIIAPHIDKISQLIQSLAQRIPVITLATDIPDSARMIYVGPNNYQLGRVAGELMGRFLGSTGGEVIVILGVAKMHGHTERERGFKSILQESFPHCHIINSFESYENSYEMKKIIISALREYKNIKGIYNISDENPAISEVLNTTKLDKKMTLITHELTPIHEELLKKGVIDAIIDQNPELEAKQILNTIIHYFHNDKNAIPEYDYTPFNIYLRESLL
ncbi:ABC-type sugar transport system [Commensalibacter communis]|nr:ABC-type sugar transport system [Commensalibacter communis]